MAVLARILVVEDDDVQADLTVRVLEFHGFYVERASTGLEAVHSMLAGWFDVVLMDYSIPELDGVAVGRVITDLTRTLGRPFLVALTASPDLLQQREAAAASVFDAVIGKPWDPNHLVSTIERCHAAAPPAAYRRTGAALSRPGNSNSPAGHLASASCSSTTTLCSGVS